MLSDALMFGTSYAAIERGAITGPAAQLHPLDPEVIRADVYEGQQIFRDKDTGVIYYPEDLIILESFRGKSPIRLHMENLGITAAAMEYGAWFGTRRSQVRILPPRQQNVRSFGRAFFVSAKPVASRLCQNGAMQARQA